MNVNDGAPLGRFGAPMLPVWPVDGERIRVYANPNAVEANPKARGDEVYADPFRVEVNRGARCSMCSPNIAREVHVLRKSEHPNMVVHSIYGNGGFERYVSMT